MKNKNITNLNLKSETDQSVLAVLTPSISVGYLLNQLAEVIREETANELSAIQISPREAGVLIYIDQFENIVQQDLAERMRIDRTTTMQIVIRLEKLKLISRLQHPDDGRAYLLNLTQQGKKTVQTSKLLMQKSQIEFFKKMSPSEQNQLINLLFKLWIIQKNPKN